MANRRDGKQVFYSLNAKLVSQSRDHDGLAIAAGPLELRISDWFPNGNASANGT